MNVSIRKKPQFNWQSQQIFDLNLHVILEEVEFLVVFDEVLDHILRIDRVLRQPMGHCLLVGDSGCGKTVLSKFVSWMNGLSILQR